MKTPGALARLPRAQRCGPLYVRWLWVRMPGLGPYGSLDVEAGLVFLRGVRGDGGLDIPGQMPPVLPGRLVRLGLLRRPGRRRGAAVGVPQFQDLAVRLVGRSLNLHQFIECVCHVEGSYVGRGKTPGNVTGSLVTHAFYDAVSPCAVHVRSTRSPPPVSSMSQTTTFGSLL